MTSAPVRRAALGVALVAALVVATMIVRGDWRTANAVEPSQARPVAFGTWKVLTYGQGDTRLDVEARVVSVDVFDHLTSGGERRPAPEGTTFAVAIVECRCPVTKDLVASPMLVVDDRGRQWQEWDNYDAIDEFASYTNWAALGKAEGQKDGVTTYAETYLVATGATGLGVFADIGHGNYLYR